MNHDYNTPPDPKNKKQDASFNETLPDQTPRREGGEDSFAEASPDDSRSDEKVIVNEQVSNKTVNAPSQTAANTSEGSGSDDEIIN